jgi:hypothetical protein
LREREIMRKKKKSVGDIALAPPHAALIRKE